MGRNEEKNSYRGVVGSRSGTDSGETVLVFAELVESGSDLLRFVSQRLMAFAACQSDWC